MPDIEKTKRTTVLRGARRAVFDRDTVYAILDKALVCQVAFIDANGRPAMVPTNHWRVGDKLFIHGSPKGRLCGVAEAGGEVCLNVAIADGLVLGRSAYHHSLNYRSVVAYASPMVVADPKEKMRALEAFIEKLQPGRWADVRPPTETELKITSVVVLDLNECSAKVRGGPPMDEEADYALPVWAGEVPLSLVRGEPVPDPRLDPNCKVPDYLKG